MQVRVAGCLRPCDLTGICATGKGSFQTLAGHFAVFSPGLLPEDRLPRTDGLRQPSQGIEVEGQHRGRQNKTFFGTLQGGRRLGFDPAEALGVIELSDQGLRRKGIPALCHPRPLAKHEAFFAGQIFSPTGSDDGRGLGWLFRGNGRAHVLFQHQPVGLAIELRPWLLRSHARGRTAPGRTWWPLQPRGHSGWTRF